MRLLEKMNFRQRSARRSYHENNFRQTDHAARDVAMELRFSAERFVQRGEKAKMALSRENIRSRKLRLKNIPSEPN